MPSKFIPAPPLPEYPELLAAVAEELHLRQPDGPEDAPLVVEEYSRHHDRVSVRVFWDRWAGVSHQDRCRVIQDAYYKIRGTEAVLKISSTLGLSQSEARRLGIKAIG